MDQETLQQPPQASADPAAKPEAKPQPPAETPPAKKPLYEGIGGEFVDADELASYTKRLEDQLVAAKAQTQQPAVQVSQPNLSQSPDLADMLFSDPQKAVDVIKEQLRMERKKEEADKQAEAQWWENFYKQNQDLKSNNRIVQSVARENFQKYRAFSPEIAAKKLAQDARELVSEVRRNAGVSESELPQGKSVGVGTSGQPAARQAAPAPLSMTFAEQVKVMNRKRKGL